MRGERRKFSVPIDWQMVRTAFQRRVLGELLKVPYGQVISYQALARRIGGIQFARAVGGAVARNPLPLLIPCHRVIHQNGSVGGFTGGGVSIKRWLLDLEQS